ncbi:sphingomyelin phosphodiesterase-like [Nylanderia fulva]|uniref:sphingomyelin phosphodiesterase-like n=1 Tax=Nylanderia fulva TaxID=613905 RepID=UPI0010FB68A2|nr:sphingomyelin phosphodiesterase-like [Nylanderia fulva]
MQFYKVLFFAFLLKIANSDVTINKDEMILRFSGAINNWVQTGEESEEFQNLLNNLTLPINLHRINWRSSTSESSNAICTLCRTVFNTFIEFRRKGMSANYIKSNVIKLCTRLNVETENVCTGVVTLHLPIILHIVDTKPNLTASTICGVILESQSCPLTDDEFEWTVNIDSSPPKLVDADESEESINIIQITDIHYDPNYEPNGNANCNEPTCCRKGQNVTNTSNKVAGYWGDYNYCDSPWHAVVDILEQIRDTHQNISYIYFTGDIVDHGVWETSAFGNIVSLYKSYSRIYETFRNTPVYPILGNHEAHPVNLYAPKSVTDNKINTQWLFNATADLWINVGWLPESTRLTILEGGYYTISPKKGFRIIALNSNVCYSANWWLWYQPRDPYGQLQWLADTLLQAEKDGEFVHILAHIPSNNECHSTWKREYLKIVDRFARIIKAQFNGHTHNDEILLFYSNDNSTTINNVAWNGGSATPSTKLNPNYKLYIVDNKNYAVKDIETWMYNLTEANANAPRRPSWYKSYSFKEEYDIPDLSYNSLHNWLHKLIQDDNLLSRYYRNFFKRAEPSLNKECDTKCMRAYVCRVITSLGDHRTYCN